MKKLIATLTLALLVIGMTTFALAAPAGQSFSYTGCTVVTGAECTQSGTGSPTGSDVSSILNDLKSLGITYGAGTCSQNCSSTKESPCGTSAKDTQCPSSDSTCGTASNTPCSTATNTTSNSAGTATSTTQQTSSGTAVSDATTDTSKPADSSPAPACDSACTAANTNTENSCTAGNCTTPGSSRISGNCSTSDSTCTSGNCTTPGSSCTAGNCTTPGSSCTAGNCTTPGSSCTAGNCSTSDSTCTAGNCSQSASKNALSGFLAGLLQKCGSQCTQLSSYLKNLIGLTSAGSSAAPTETPSTPSSSGKDNSVSGGETTVPGSGDTTAATTADIDNLSYEEQVVSLVNEQRAAYGLQPLTLSEELSNVARLKSQDMHDNNYFSHTSPTYGTPFEMLSKFDIHYTTAGENIAMGYATPEAVVDAWMNSAGHRANILNGSFTEIGVGYVADGNYWTQEFIG